MTWYLITASGRSCAVAAKNREFDATLNCCLNRIASIRPDMVRHRPSSLKFRGHANEAAARLRTIAVRGRVE
jgi:hypothetical protein